MEITYLGVILMPLGLIWLACSERWLYRATIFFVPFTASALANFPSGFWLSPVQYFGSLWLLRFALGHLAIMTGKMRLTFWLMSAFFAVVVASIAMPMFIDGDLFVRGTILLEATGPLYFSLRNLTAPTYLLFGLLFAAFVSVRSSNEAALQETLRVYVSSALFVAAWGVFQFACNITGGEYPYFIFNNSANEVAQGYASIILDLSEATFRVTSVATEASVMAQFLVPALPVVVFAVLLKQPILSPFLDFVTVVAIIAVLLVSTSSTAYLGLVLCAMAVLIVLAYLRRAGFGVWLSCGVVIGIMVMGYVSIDFFRAAADYFVLDKLATGSGIERLLTVEYAWGYFLKYPILGVGWGSATSNDLIVSLLVNAGILGLGTFAALAGYVIVRLTGAVVSSRRTHALRKTTLAENRSLAILVAFLLILALQASGGIQYSYAHFWLTLGLAIAAPSILRVTISPMRHGSISRLRAAAQ